MPKASSRPSLPTSSTDFALPPSSSNPVASTSSVTLDDASPLLQRFRRPSLLAPKAGYLSEARLHSPLAASFILHPGRRRGNSNAMIAEDAESDRERMCTDSSSSASSSENPTPPLRLPENSSEEQSSKRKLPSTPPRKTSISSMMDVQEPYPPNLRRRLSFPRGDKLRQPRILNLLAESRPEEDEVKSEAAFQKLITSCSELPTQPRTPRNVTDRGRYPEEAGLEESPREDTPSDDEDGGEEAPFAFSAATESEPIPIQKPRTPMENLCTDDLSMHMSESPIFSPLAMDVDVPYGSPSFSTMASAPISQWRYTPPPTTSAVRSNKRKLDDRFDPYPTASKRRAVSPSMAYLRDSHPGIGSPGSSSRGNGRLPIAIPINIPGSAVSSATSSPTITGSFPIAYPRPMSITSSPTLRATMALGSPILRPVPRAGALRRLDGDEREIEGAGEGVNSLTLT